MRTSYPVVALACALSLGLACAARPNAGAAASGLAYDTVTHTNMGAMMGQSGSASLAPADSFDDDFNAAAKPRSSGKINIFNPGKAIQASMDALKSGTAERHFFMGARERVDDPAAQTSTITDCAAGTRTTLNHANKTYHVESLWGTPSPAGTAAPVTASHATPPPDDGTRIAMKMTTTALGPKTIDAVPTQGYASDMQITVTKPGQNPQSTDMKTQLYVSNYAQPSLNCPVPLALAQAEARGARPNPGAGYSAILASMFSKDKRVTASMSGPPLPVGKLPVFEVLQPALPQGQGGSSAGSGFAITIQNGHIHTLGDADAALFSPPPDYKEV